MVLAGTERALLIAAALLVLTPLAGLRWRLAGLSGLDLREGDAWSEPHLPVDPDPVSGPVMVRLSYDVPSGKAQDFVAAMNELGRIRKEHVRQAQRLTRNDLDLLDRIAGLTTEGRRPNALHGLAVAPGRQPT